MFELTYRNKKVTELTDIQSQKVHTGGTKFAKKNKHTCTTIRDTRVRNQKYFEICKLFWTRPRLINKMMIELTYYISNI